ncbi:ABC transporter ATP-binding protein [Gemmobacter caeruleus]|uniref:ABC transporter ATP-binding protein n=1 Tax=Gemmobacter caeruleus TaxID=2595004 RepID=UPI0011EDC0D6|nr:ABC transporter ATP-binding protein [Gemmobacter caeruleus]
MTALLLRGSALRGGRVLLRDLDLAVAAGQWTCLLGPSGVGKTTILRLCAGLANGVEWRGRLVTPGPGQVALMAQDDLLLPWLSARDNVALGARLRGVPPDLAQADRLLARVGLAGRAGHKPAALSGGERQRVALARTLMEDRPVILLDEPFSALDAGTRARMQDLAAELLARRTVLMVTHDPAEAARLGEAIHILTGAGAERIVPPAGPIPRAVEDPGLLRVQAALLARLRAGVPCAA